MIDGFRPTRRAPRPSPPFAMPPASRSTAALYTVFPGPQLYRRGSGRALLPWRACSRPPACSRRSTQAGARPAAPGEFTRRAVLNGKLDLVQAEAVGDLIDATAPGAGPRRAPPARRRPLPPPRRAAAARCVETEGLLALRHRLSRRRTTARCRRRASRRSSRRSRRPDRAAARHGARRRAAARGRAAGARRPAQRRQVVAVQRAARQPSARW